ncbi:MAG TPA: polynucleotide adenylyltransferase PcnB [Polyangiales bacterium]|nr:polynucleotide adenylyltransferase PcnB [Polyangiales bacterium]
MESSSRDLDTPDFDDDLSAARVEGRPKARADRDRDSEAVTYTGPAPEVYPGLISQDRVDPDAVKVLKRLTRHGHTAYLVGGGVRDLLLNRSPKDFDIATSARPGEVRRLFRNCRVIGRRFRLAHILFAGGKIIEVATFRKDPRELGGTGEEGEGESARDTISPGDDADLLIRQDNTFGDPHEDAIRRDFTINGLFYDLEREEVIDYIGGVADLRSGVVRTIGQPDVRFREDPIRILRAIKFSARLDLGIAPDVYDAMVDLREELSRSAPPRVLEEILRLLRGGAAQRSIYLAWDVGALAVVLPELCAYLDDQGKDSDLLWARLSHIDRMKEEDRLPSDTVLLGALLYGALEEAVQGVQNPHEAFEEFFQEMTTRLSLPRRMRDKLRLVFAAQRRLAKGQGSGIAHRDFYADACDLFEIRMKARGAKLPEGFREPREAPRERERESQPSAARQESAPAREQAPRESGEPRRRRRGGRRRRPGA